MMRVSAQSKIILSQAQPARYDRLTNISQRIAAFYGGGFNNVTVSGVKFKVFLKFLPIGPTWAAGPDKKLK